MSGTDTVKIFCAAHRTEDALKTDLVTPILAGAGISGAEAEGCLADSSGDNISEKNASYNEMTAAYWLYKHYSEIGSPDIIVFQQYRRMFAFGGEYNYYECEKIGEKELEYVSPDAETIEKLFEQADFLAPYPMRCKSVALQYAAAHGAKDAEIALGIIAEKTPEYLETAEKYFAGGKSYLFNMFAFRREVFLRYAEWIFGILEEFEKRRPGTGRLFISERLTGVFFSKLISEGAAVKHLPVMFFRGATPGVVGAAKLLIGGIKEKKGLKASLKPLLIALMPSLWLKRKRRIFCSEKEL